MTKNKMNDIIDNLLVFWVIFSSGAVLFLSYYSTLLLVSVPVFLIIILLRFKRLRFSYPSVLLLLLLTIQVIVTFIINSDFRVNSYMAFIIKLIEAFLIANIIDLDKFAEKYIFIIVFLTKVSFAFIALWHLLPSIFEKAPIIYMDGQLPYYNFYVFTASVKSVIYSSALFRNPSIFWEPGAFQVYLNMALVFSLICKIRLTKKNISIIVVGIVSTFSTVGILIMVLILISGGFLSLQTKQLKRWVSALVIISVFFIMASGLFSEIFLSKFDENSLSHASYEIRLRGTLTDFEYFLNKPFTGNGFTNYTEKSIQGLSENASANSITSTLAIFGIGFAVCLLILIIRLINLKTNNIVHFTTISMSIILILSTQNFFLTPMFLILAFYSIIRERIASSYNG